MSEAQFNVIFKGVLEGFDAQQVQASFAQLFSLDEERVARIFATTSTTLKPGVSEATANQFISRLAAIGVHAVAVIQPSAAAQPVTAVQPAVVRPSIAMAQPSIAMAQASAAVAEVPVSPAVPSQAAPETEQEHKFEFFGKGFEYFKIWIVNILMTILTLGIYSPWAKVRNLQYFYGNTRLNNASFEYTAKPLQILKGRIIALVFLVAYSVLSQTSPMLALVMAVVLLVALPWIVVLSLRFNARYTSYRNIAFRFHGSVGGAFKTFVGWPLLAFLSLFILLPFAWKRQAQYIINNHSYGETPFSFDVNVGEYYKMLLIVIGGTVVFFVIYALLIGGGSMAMAGSPAGMLAMMVPMMLLYLGFYLVVGAYMIVTMANIQFNNSKLGEHRFTANWQTLSYMKLLFVNTLLILLTLGLYIPFAKVRTAAYKAQHTQFIAVGDVDSFVAGEKEHTSSLAEGVNDLFAMDISI